MRDVGSGSQIDIILDVITEGIGKSRLEIFVGVSAGTTSEIQNHALRRHDAAARFENRVIELNDALSGRVFDHRVAILRTLASRVQVFGVDSHVLFRLCGANPQECTGARLESPYNSATTRRQIIESVSRSTQLPTPNSAALPRWLAVSGLGEPHGRCDDKNGTVSRRSAVIVCKDQRVFWWDATGFDYTLREAA